MNRRVLVTAGLGVLVLAGWRAGLVAAQETVDTVARVKRSIVAVGTFQKTRVPQFRFRGTGFAVDDGSTVATNLHVIPESLEAGADPELIAIAVPTGERNTAQVRFARKLAESSEHDLALLKFSGAPLPALTLGDSNTVREGERYVFTGFPVGSVMGLFPATHGAMIAAIAPVVIPPVYAQQLEAKTLRQLQGKPFPMFELDATSYVGNSGSPLYDARTGEVIGIVNMTLVQRGKEAATIQGPGIPFAIPSRHLAALIVSAKAAEPRQ